MTTTTKLETREQRARRRARESRIRAYVRVPGERYTVISPHSRNTPPLNGRYIVWYNYQTHMWHCTCSAKYASLCKHRQRVMDREAKRIRQATHN